MPDENDTPLGAPQFPESFVRKHWQYFIGILAVAIVFLVANELLNPCGLTNCFKIKALPTYRSGNGVQGQFEMVHGYFNGIETDGMGGGCLVFKNEAGGYCSKQSDCAVPNGLPQDAGAYCEDNQCWIKLTEKHCWKSLFQEPNPIPLEVDKPITITAPDLGEVANQIPMTKYLGTAEARVLACLNGKFPKDADPPCAVGSQPADHDSGKSSSYKL